MLDVNDVTQLDPVIRQRERWESRWRLASPAGDAGNQMDQPTEA